VLGLENLVNSSTNDDTYNHNHGISRGTRFITGIRVTKDRDGNVTAVNATDIGWTPSGAHTHGRHSHTVTPKSHHHKVVIPPHAHDVRLSSHVHDVSIPSHTHSVSVPSHTHGVSIPSHTHALTLPDHVHEIQYGIYKGTSASSMSVQIDGRAVGTFEHSASNVNLIAYMSKNANGEVMRGRHTIQITPDTLTRVECAIQIRLFTNAHGAGQY
jgi:hypothetical protein